ncbi:hypothetical protein QOT17_021900 [Balamuthia mandrillaris]
MFPVFDDGLVNVSLIPYHDFMLSLYEHRHQALEVACLPREHVWLEQAPIEFQLDPDILRRTALWEAKRGFRNAGNKLRVLGATPYNYKRAKKEVIHALRYLLFAIQLVQTGTIHDYAAANDYQQSILSESSTSTSPPSPPSCSSSASSSVDETNEEETKKDNVTLRFNQAILAKYKPIFQSLREKLKSLRTYSHFYSKRETERQGMKTMMELYWQQQRQQQQMVEPETWKLEADEKEASLDVVTYLRDETEKCGGNWTEALQRLAASRNVCYCFHSEYPNLVFLRHDPFTPSTPSYDTANIKRETCKGLILDITCNWKVVARFSSDPEESHDQTKKEAQTEEEEKEEIEVTEYLEGTPALLYHYNRQWHISSMYEPAKPQMDLSWKGDSRNITFESLFWNTWNRDGYSLPNDTSRCYTFVLQTPLHRYITRPEQDRLIFVGATTIPSLQECHDLTAIAEEKNWLTPRVFPELVSLNQVFAKAKTLNPFLTKGLVVRFHCSGRLVKVRCPLHVAVALGTDFSGVGPLNLRADMDERHMLELLRYNCSETFIRYLPTWQTFHKELSDKYERMCSSLDHAWNQLKEHGDDKKQFAKAANRHQFAFLLFRLYRLWKEDLREYLSARQVFGLCDDHMFSRAWSAFE